MDESFSKIKQNMLTFTLPAFILGLIITFLAGIALGIWISLNKFK